MQIESPPPWVIKWLTWSSTYWAEFLILLEKEISKLCSDFSINSDELAIFSSLWHERVSGKWKEKFSKSSLVRVEGIEEGLREDQDVLDEFPKIDENVPSQNPNVLLDFLRIWHAKIFNNLKQKLAVLNYCSFHFRESQNLVLYSSCSVWTNFSKLTEWYYQSRKQKHGPVSCY